LQPVISFVLGGHLFAAASYSVMMSLAATVTLGLAIALAFWRGLPRARSVACLATMAVSVPVGARLLHATINRDLYIKEPDRLLAVDFGGFSLYGGLLLAAAMGLLACRLLGVDVVRLADATAPALGVGIATMRVGCFLAGCCFGYETDLPWGAVFPIGSNAHIYQLSLGHNLFNWHVEPVHPTQLYELAAGLIGGGLAGWLLWRRFPDGVPFLAFIAWFSAFRWANWYLRVPPATLVVPYWFYPVLYAFIIGLCGYLLWQRLRRRPAKSCIDPSLPTVQSGAAPGAENAGVKEE
jgi:phosphatidylglycerol---prolipoprotein diacylglyceryl transferase